MASNKKKYNLYRYSDSDVDRALADVKKGTSVGKAAKEYGIPKSTLHAKLTGKAPEHCNKGPKTVLTAEEESRLKQWILNKARLGFLMHPDEVKDAVQKVLNEASRKTIFTNNRPGDKWQQLFLKRHPEIMKRNIEMISKGQPPVTEENLREWSQELKSYLEENGFAGVLERPKSIFNGDETSIQLSPKSGQLLGPKNKKDFYENSSGKEKETLTVLCTFSAAGDALPPMIKFPYKRIPALISDSVPYNWPIGRSDTGWMVSSTFYKYIANNFYPWCVNNGVEFPVIYFLNGHKSHLTIELSDFCIRHNIILYSLYPNSTHITQPCDVAIFRSLKCKWRQVVHDYKQSTKKSVTKATFAPLFKKAFDKISDTSIKNGFRVCGLYPFDENAVRYQKCISTRRRELNSTSAVENPTVSLTYADFLSTKKFFDHFIDEEKLEEFVNMGNNNETCNDPVYILWKTCIDELNDCPIDNDTVNIELTPNFCH